MKCIYTAASKGLSNEDTGVFYALDALTKDEAKQHITALGNKVTEIVSSHAKDLEQVGACYISTIATNDGWIQGECCGDSQATLFIYDPTTKTVRHKVLNNLHNPLAEKSVLEANGKDTARGELLGKHTSRNRLNDRLEVSRAFGDYDYEKYGLSHEREFFEEQINLQPGERAFLMTSSDGLVKHYDPLKCLLDEYKQILVSSIENSMSIKEIGNAILGIAQKSSPDDRTLSFYEVGQREAIVSVVCDGHRGKIGSELCAEAAARFAKENGGQDVQVFIEAKIYDTAIYDNMGNTNVVSIETKSPIGGAKRRCREINELDDEDFRANQAGVRKQRNFMIGNVLAGLSFITNLVSPHHPLSEILPIGASFIGVCLARNWQSLSVAGIICGEKIAEVALKDKMSSTALAHIGSIALVAKLGLIAACVSSLFFSKDKNQSHGQGQGK